MREVPCPLLRQCGGCDAMREDEADQLSGKVRGVEQRLRREIREVYSSPNSLHYRARVTFRLDDKGRLCYYRPRTHIAVPVDACAVARPEINRAIRRFDPLPKAIQSVEFRSNGEQVIVVFQTPPKRVPIVEKALRDWSWVKKGVHGVFINKHHIYGLKKTTLEVCGVKHLLGPNTFYQVNLEVNELLVMEISRLVGEYNPTAVLDLFSGAGNLSFPLAQPGRTLTLMEFNPDAVRDAKATAKRLGCQADIRQLDATRYRAGDAFFDLAILDPARAGASGVMQELAVTRPRAMIYVSCNPQSFARDAREVTRVGYRLKNLAVYDMFPQTSHTELLGVFELN